MTDTLLPPSSTSLESALVQTAAAISELPTYRLWDPNTCPVVALPALAWALSVEQWDDAWPEAVKRDVCAAALPIHARKGTLWALRSALDAAGYVGAHIEEWFEYGGAPYTGKIHIHVYSEGIDDTTWATLWRIVEQNKNERSQFDVRLYLTVKSEVPRLAIAGQAAEEVTIWPWNTLDLSGSSVLSLALGAQSVETVTLYPQ